MNSRTITFAAAAMLAAAAAALPARAAVDIVQAPTDFFAPGQAETFDPPYYRGANEDWGWQHGPLADQNSPGTAFLRISAFDVDFDNCGQANCERDGIYVGTDNTGTFLGYLQGANNVYAFTDFVLTDPAVLAQVVSGLPLFIDIDELNGGWLVTLGRSVLCSNVDSVLDCVANPNPGVPEPASLALLGTGLAGLGLAALRRRRAA